MKKKNVFWGLLFILGALAVLVSKLGVFEGVGFWSVLFSIGLIGILINGIIRRSWGTILFSTAFLAIVNSRLLGIEKLVPWPVLGAALLGTIGLNMLFPSRHHHGHYVYNGGIGGEVGEVEYHEEVSNDGSEQVNCGVSFHSSVKYIQCTQLKSLNLDSSFGGLTVYLNNAVLKGHEAFVNVDVSFGNMELYIPAGWRVICNVSSSFGSVQEHGRCRGEEADMLTINGEVSFGTLDIYYI